MSSEPIAQRVPKVHEDCANTAWYGAVIMRIHGVMLILAAANIGSSLTELGKELHKQYQELTLLETRSILAVD
jgi:hypothetical protein